MKRKARGLPFIIKCLQLVKSTVYNGTARICASSGVTVSKSAEKIISYVALHLNIILMSGAVPRRRCTVLNIEFADVRAIDSKLF